MSNITEPKLQDPFQNPFEKQLADSIFSDGKSKDEFALVPRISEEIVQVCTPTVKTIVEKPVLAEVKEVKNVDIVHKDIVQEIHEQPIIEIAKKNETVHVVEKPFVQRIEAPAKYEEITNVDLGRAEFKIPQRETKHLEEIGDIKHVNLGEDIKQVSTQEVIERHVVPTITEIRQQRVINVIEQPIVRKIVEKPIIREFSTEGDFFDLDKFQPVSFVDEELRSQGVDTAPMRDSTLERERQVPSVQESTHVLMRDHPHGPFSNEQFADELSRGKTLLKKSHPFSSEQFKEDIFYGQEVLHTAKPFAQEGFALKLQERKATLNKSRYFSKEVRPAEFLAQKKLLKPVENNKYSDELNALGSWKTDSIVIHALESAQGFLKSTYQNLTHKVVDTFESVKEKVIGSNDQ
jgi:hypothetical protein